MPMLFAHLYPVPPPFLLPLPFFLNRALLSFQATRNCMVAANLTAKIGDFGLSRSKFANEYSDYNGESVPVRWMAPELLLKKNPESTATYVNCLQQEKEGIVPIPLITLTSFPNSSPFLPSSSLAETSGRLVLCCGRLLALPTSRTQRSQTARSSNTSRRAAAWRRQSRALRECLS